MLRMVVQFFDSWQCHFFGTWHNHAMLAEAIISMSRIYSWTPNKRNATN